MIHPHETHTRDELANLFWANSDERNARKALSTSLWRLRKTIEKKCRGEPYIVTMGRSELTFNSNASFWCDVVQFEQTLVPLLNIESKQLNNDHAAAMEDTLKLYQGDLLAGYYDDWVIRKREWLRSIRLRTLDNLLRYYIDQQSPSDTLRCGQLILGDDPLREDVYRHMMRAYASLGELEAARQLYKQCSRELATNLNISPLPETLQTLRHIQKTLTKDGEAVSFSSKKTISLIRQELFEARELILHALDRLKQLEK